MGGPPVFMPAMRAFIALPVADDTVDALVRLQAALPFGKPVPEENLHLTLAFLGDVSEADLAEIDIGLSMLRWPAVQISFSGLDTFTELERGLVFAAVRPSASLDGLHRKVEGIARSAGIQLPRRRFRPHVTVMRANRRPRGMARDRLAATLGARADIPGFLARDVVLYASTLTPAGAVHDALETYPLLDMGA